MIISSVIIPTMASAGTATKIIRMVNTAASSPWFVFIVKIVSKNCPKVDKKLFTLGLISSPTSHV